MESSESKSDHIVSSPELAGGEAPNLLKPWQDPSLFVEHDVQNNYVTGGAMGIAMAGAVYPFVVSCLVAFCSILFTGIIDPVYGIIFVAAFSIIGGLCGFAIAGIVGGLAVLLVMGINRSLGYPLDARSASISAGSLAGYASTVWILFDSFFATDLVETAIIVVMGPILAMTMGAIGAARASSKYGGYDFSVASQRRKQRISILHLMVATAWIAVALAIANSFGGSAFAFAVIGWFVLQAFMLGFISAVRKMRKPVES